MKYIEQMEKHLPDKRKALLHRLRVNDWIVVGVDDADSDWALDEKWIIESTRESKGLRLTLWIYKYDGLHDGVDRVVATPSGASEPGCYSSGSPSLELDSRHFEKGLDCFISAIHEFRAPKSLNEARELRNGP